MAIPGRVCAVDGCQESLHARSWLEVSEVLRMAERSRPATAAWRISVKHERLIGGGGGWAVGSCLVCIARIELYRWQRGLVVVGE